MFLLLIGRWLQGRQRRRAAETSELLTALAPSSARRLEASGPRLVPLEALSAGDRVEVLSGEGIPADGVVVEGQGSVDRSLLTGESRPVAVSAEGEGDPVHAGAICRGGRLVIRVSAAGEETRLAAILRQVDALSANKAPVVAWANRVAGLFVLAVLTLALLTFLGWSWAAPALALDHALALLIVTCPCALGLATPLAVDAALARAARLGAIVKGGDVLQRLAGQASAPLGPLALLDKTGTLSEGRFSLASWEVAEGEDAAALQARVLSLEASSAHPIAEGFRAAWGEAEGEGLEVGELPGGGLEAEVAGQRWRAGAPAASGRSRRSRVPPAAVARGPGPGRADARGGRARPGEGRAGRDSGTRCVQEAPESRSGPARRGRLAGRAPLGRSPAAWSRPSAAELGVAAARGGATPEAKAARVEEARAAGYGPILMVGDGVNDAAALGGGRRRASASGAGRSRPSRQPTSTSQSQASGP